MQLIFNLHFSIYHLSVIIDPMKKALITDIPGQGGSNIIEKIFIILVSNKLQR